MVAPTRVDIPNVDIAAEIVPVGVATDGQMALPPDPNDVGWYEFGPAPIEQRGSVVLGGHLDSTTYGVGQLARLRDLEPDDEVVVSSADGSTQRYLVATVERYDKAALPLQELFARDGEPVLVIITCAGAFLRDSGGYQENLVVTARPW